jgi:hypothetical protein
MNAPSDKSYWLLLRISPAAADASHSQSVFMLHAARAMNKC